MVKEHNETIALGLMLVGFVLISLSYLFLLFASIIGLITLDNVEVFRTALLTVKYLVLFFSVSAVAFHPRSWSVWWFLCAILWIHSFSWFTENHGKIEINERILNISNRQEAWSYLAIESGEYEVVNTKGSNILFRKDGNKSYLDYGVGSYPGKYVMLKNPSGVVLGRVFTNELKAYGVSATEIELTEDSLTYPVLVVSEDTVGEAENLVAERGKVYEPLGKEVVEDYWSRAYLRIPMSMLLLDRILK